MELRHMRYFMAVAEHRNFSRAAEELGIKQPPLSQQIQALETELGVTLFNRSRQGTGLTAAGEAFAAHAREALTSAAAARAAAQQVGRGECGRLAIGFLPSAFDTVLPRVLSAFLRRWPQVAVEPVEFALTSDAVAALRKRSVDFAIGRPPVAGTARGDDLHALQLVNDQINVVLPRRHVLAERARIEPRILQAERFVLTPLEERPPRYWQSICVAAGFEPLVAGRVQGAHTVIGMVAAGVGLGLVPQSARLSAREDVVFIPLAPSIVAPPLTLLWRRDDERRVGQNFQATVRDVLHLTGKFITGQELDEGFRGKLREQVGRVT